MGGGKIDPRILRTLCVLIIATVWCAGCSKSKPSKAAAPEAENSSPVLVSKSLFHNPDSLLYYAERAYLHDDPEGLYVTGVAAYLRAQDPFFPDSCTTVSLDEADIMLLHAAELGHKDAAQLIHCLDSHGQWHHSLPETK